MIRILVIPRLALLLALSLGAGVAAASPPANVSQRVYMCGARLYAQVDLTFGQTASTASVLAKSEPLKVNPYSPGGYTPYQPYTIRTRASTRPNASAAWSTTENTGEGVAGVTMTPVSSGKSTFKSVGCEVKGSVYIFTLCPPESPIGSDGALIERTWTSCEL